MNNQKRTGGDRLVRITNGRGEYVESANYTFGIVVFGPKERAAILTLSDAVTAIADINRYGVHRLYAELVTDR